MVVAGGLEVRIEAGESRVNLLSRSLLLELSTALERWGRSREFRWILLATTHGRPFAAGADLAEIAALDGLAAWRLSRLGQSIFARWRRLPLPTASLVQGHALGGGFDLAIACDLLGLVGEAAMGHPGIKRGFFTGWGGTAHLPRQARAASGFMPLLDGDPRSGADAVSLGLVSASDRNEVVVRRRLLAQLERLSEWPEPALHRWRLARSRALEPRLAGALRRLELTSAEPGC